MRWIRLVTPLDNVLVHLLLLISFPFFPLHYHHRHQTSKIIIVADVTLLFQVFCSINWLTCMHIFRHAASFSLVDVNVPKRLRILKANGWLWNQSKRNQEKRGTHLIIFVLRCKIIQNKHKITFRCTFEIDWFHCSLKRESVILMCAPEVKVGAIEKLWPKMEKKRKRKTHASVWWNFQRFASIWLGSIGHSP